VLDSPPTIRPTTASQIDTAPRLLLDVYACLGPVVDGLVPLLSKLVHGCAAAGVALCVDSAAWNEAAVDPDIRRRGIDLRSFAPLVQLPTLPVPSSRDLSSRFVPVRNETDAADLRLLGALHSRVADVLVTQDTRLRRLADRAGISARVLTIAEALRWTQSLQGRLCDLTVREVPPSSIVAEPQLDELLTHEFDAYDPYLRPAVSDNRGRALIVTENGSTIGFAILSPGTNGPQLEMQAIAVEPCSLGAIPLESLILASRTMARRRDSDLHILLPPYADFSCLLLEQLGFERRGQDRHGRVRFVDSPESPPADAQCYWMLHLDPKAHATLLPEIGGLAQQQLFSGDDCTAGSPAAGVRRQITIPRQAREPGHGDVVFAMHGRADSLAASRAVTAVLVVEQVIRCDNPTELMIANCRHGTLESREIPGLLSDGGATVLTLRMLGRLEHPVPFARLKQLGLVRSLPHALRRLEPTAVARLLPSLSLV